MPFHSGRPCQGSRSPGACRLGTRVASRNGVTIIARSAYSVPLTHQEPMSVRPSVRLRPHRSAKSPKNGPPETDLRAEIPGSRVPFLIHFWDLAQIRQLTQSESIIHILCVDNKKKPRNELLKASRPPPAGVV